LEFKGRRLPLAAPGRNTQLFFLDEATALAAGHRPCAECRRERYDEFRAAWIEINPVASDRKLGADDIDRVLHAERAVRGGGKGEVAPFV
jgi:methylphosphotriester-DNA--protein-cysteine methyltransferase